MTLTIDSAQSDSLMNVIESFSLHQNIHYQTIVVHSVQDIVLNRPMIVDQLLLPLLQSLVLIPNKKSSNHYQDQVICQFTENFNRNWQIELL